MGTIGKPTPITREDIAKIDPVKLETIRRGGRTRRRGGSSSRLRAKARKKAAREAKAKAARAKAAAAEKERTARVERRKIQIAQQKAIAIAQTNLAKAQRRIALQSQSRLINKGAQEVLRNFRNQQGQRVRHSTVSRGRERVFTVRNLDTGEFTVKHFRGTKGRRGMRKVSETISTGGARVAKAGARPKVIKKTREQRIQAQMQRVRDLGMLPTRASATRIVDARISSEKEKEFIRLGEVQPIAEETNFIKKSIRKLEVLQAKSSTASIRKQQKDIKNELKLLGLTTGLTVVAGVSAFAALPSTAINIAKNPKQLLDVPSSIAKAGEEFGQLIRISPTEAVGRIAGEVVLLKGTGKVFKVVGKIKKAAAAKFLPVLNKADKTLFAIDKAGKVKIKLAGGTASTAESLAKQASRAGKKAVGVSAQADDIVNLVRTKRVIRKPIPGEKLLSKTTKKLLKNFDDGQISRNRLIELDRRIRIETKGQGNLLERSFFADPAGRVRTSRLGIGKTKDASLVDVLSGDFTFRTKKPQILVFDDIKVQKFPKNLQPIAKKLKAGKTLTQVEADKLLKFQLKKSGKFKPIGALSKESEITLAPGEIVKKSKTVGHVKVNGQKVPVVKATVVKAKGELKTLLKKVDDGRIKPNELKKLESLLSKETGFKNSLSRSGNSRPVANLPGIISSPRLRKRVKKARAVVATRTTRKKPTIKRDARFVKGSPEAKRFMKRIREGRSVGRQPVRRVPTTTVPPIPPVRRPTPRPPTRGPPRRPPAKPPVKPPIKKPTKPTKKKPLETPVQVFDVFGKSKGKFVKLNIKPLTRADALSKGAFAVDRTTSQSFKIAPKGKSKSPGKLLKSERNYFNRQGFKLREVKIKKGRKFQLKNKYIEKRKFTIDTPTEKSGLTLAKHIQQRKKAAAKRATPTRKRAVRAPVRRRNTRRVTRAPPKRTKKLTPTQLRNLRLKNLAKARRVRMKNLKGGKRK